MIEDIDTRLTREGLVNAINILDEGEILPRFPHETKAYIYVLFEPYANAIVQQVLNGPENEKIRTVEDWMRNTFKQIKPNPDDFIRPETIGEMMALRVDEESEDDKSLILISIRALIEDLLALISDDINLRDFDGQDTTPWDIKGALYRNEILRELFNITRDSVIPIKVTIGDKISTHNMSAELAKGIIVGYKYLQQQNPLSLFSWYTMTQTPPFDDRLSQNNNIGLFRYNPTKKKYTAMIGETMYEFETAEFIQGVLTATSWTKRQIPITDITESGMPMILKY
jgi:hypothetical protein